MESTSRESLGGEKMEATFSKKENTRKAKTKKAEKVTPGGILVIILLTLLALITLVPFIWMVSAHLKQTMKFSPFQFNGFLKVGIQKTIPLFGNAFRC